MNKPVITDRLQGFTFVWQEHGLTINVSKTNVHRSDGRVTGEVEVQSTDDEGQPITIYPPTQFNFTSDRTRKDIVKSLFAKYPKLPWAEMLDQLCYGVQDRARRGEPVQELWTSTEARPPECLLEPILFKGLPSVIFGEKGVAKSTLALAFYFCLMLPWRDNPLELKVPERSVKTLLLDWETEGDIIHYYAKRIQDGHNLPALPILYRRCGLPLADDLEQIQRHITDTKTEVVIIDSLGAAAGGDLKTPDIALKFFTALRQLKVTSLILAQTSKDAESKRKSIFGSTYFTYYSRNILELCRSESTEENELDIALFHRWNNIGKLYRPMSFSFHYNETGLTIERRPFNIGEFMEKVSNTQKILELLKREALKQKEIANQIGASENATRVALFRLKKKGQVLQVGEAWGLPVREE